MTDINYLFVDGAYLRRALQSISKDYFDDEVIEIDPKNLTRGFRKSFYYDCLPPGKKGEDQEIYDSRVGQQRSFFTSLRHTPGVHVFVGSLRGEGKRIRQKQIDVKIAVDMLTHSYRRNMHRATLLAGDEDFKPLVDALVQDGMYVTLWYEQKSASDQLIESADNKRLLNVDSAHQIATSDFRENHPIPNSTITNSDRSIDTSIARGKTEDARPIALYKDGSTYIIETPVDKPRDYVYRAAFHERQYLERFVRQYHIDFQWES